MSRPLAPERAAYEAGAGLREVMARFGIKSTNTAARRLREQGAVLRPAHRPKLRTPDDPLVRFAARLRRRGWKLAAIAEACGLSTSRVHHLLAVSGETFEETA